jgi:hypothetical protein
MSMILTGERLQIDVWNVVSVPDGAPSASRPDDSSPAPNQDRKFSYLQSSENLLQSMAYANEVRC